MTEKIKRTPEEQAEHNSQIAAICELMLLTMPTEIARSAIKGLANVVIALAKGELKPEDIPPTWEELVTATVGTIAKDHLKKTGRVH